MKQHGLFDSQTDSRLLTLQARLVKDRAKRARGDERASLFLQSADLYTKAGRLNRSSYPLINAATLSLLAGKRTQSIKLAREALSLIEADPNEGETPFWHEATRAEALLLLGRELEGRAALGLAIATQSEAWEDHAATIGQLSLILSELGQDPSWLDDYRPPASVHFSGLAWLSHDTSRVTDAIRQFIKEERVGFAYGALAAGADLLFAQTFLEYKNSHRLHAELHVVLPLPIEQFREKSVRPFGALWVPLFDAALDQASSITIVGAEDAPLTLAIEHSDQVAMGCAVRNAHILQSRAIGLTIVASGESLRPQLAAWQTSGRKLTIIDGVRDEAHSNQADDGNAGPQLKTLVWVSNADRATILSYIDDEGSLESSEQGHWFVCETTKEAGDLATRLAYADPAARISILCAIFDPHDLPKMILERAQAFARAALPQTVSTDRNTALVLVLKGWSGPLNELGELGTLWGNESIWSIASL